MASVPAPAHADGSPARLLVVDDEDALVDLLGDALRFAGYEVQVARSGNAALEKIRRGEHDLVVLDVNLPDLDGYSLCRRLRADGQDVPVVFLTARDDPDGLRTGFGNGGDDYLTKPFSLEELRLRIEAVLRRTLRAVPEADARVLRCHDIAMDLGAHQVWRGEREVALSATEYRLLEYLLENQGLVVSRSKILNHVWEYDFGGDGQVVATYISYLRRKLGDDGTPPLITTVRGVGYSLRAPKR